MFEIDPVGIGVVVRESSRGVLGVFSIICGLLILGLLGDSSDNTVLSSESNGYVVNTGTSEEPGDSTGDSSFVSLLLLPVFSKEKYESC